MEQLTIDTVKNYKKPKKNTTEARSSDRQIAPVRLRRPGEPNSGELRRRQTSTNSGENSGEKKGTTE